MSCSEGHNKVPLTRLKPAILQYQVKHSNNDLLHPPINPDQAEQNVVHDLDSKSFGTLVGFLEYFFIKKLISKK